MQVGLKVLQDNGNVLKCHTTHWDNKWYAETGASAAVLDSGYNIGSLMRRCACTLTTLHIRAANLSLASFLPALNPKPFVCVSDCSCTKLTVSCRYEGRDWRSQDSRECEGDRELFSGLDSTFAALQEALFIPGKEGVLQTSDELLDVASAYERWMEQQARSSHLFEVCPPCYNDGKLQLCIAIVTGEVTEGIHDCE